MLFSEDCLPLLANLRRRRRTIGAVIVAAGLALAGCSAPEEAAGTGTQPGASSAAAPAESDPQFDAHGSFEDARRANRAHGVDPRFGDAPRVIRDGYDTGAETSELFFPSSETAIVAGLRPRDRLRAASIAVATNAPVLGQGIGTAEELERLGAHTVLLVGETGEVPVAEGVLVLRDTGAPGSLTSLTSMEFAAEDVAAGEEVAAVAALTPGGSGTLLREAGAAVPATPTEVSEPEGTFPVQSPRDGGAAPVVVASRGSNILDVANARAFGAEVRVLSDPDPRFDAVSTNMVAGLADRPVIALGSGFGDNESFAAAIALSDELAAANAPELPGGGRLAFPGRRMVALYGHPSGEALGVMGEGGVDAAIARVSELVEEYQALDPAEPVIPAFEIIATVASAAPGEDGDYSNETDPAELVPYIDAITAAGGYAVLDLQPGQAGFLAQAQRYEELLTRPNVGLALDPEWHIGPDEQPLQRVGSVEASEVNEVADWLAGLTREHTLPQKVFMIHQFQLQMIRDRERLRLDHPELAFVLHVDGHGSREEKLDTWRVITEELDRRFVTGWKNFIDEDQPMFTPAETLGVTRAPSFISYQ